MAMTVVNTLALDKFSRKHADARRPLATWLGLTQQASWTCLQDVRSTFPSADGVTIGNIVATVFNIKGNEYRLIAIVSYPIATVNIREVLTHAEYNKNKWKGRV